MDKRLMNLQTHFKVYLSGRCASCNAYNEEQVFDYGPLSYAEAEAKMDHVNHKVFDIACKSCGYLFPPKQIMYRDSINKKFGVTEEINYADFKNPEEYKLSEEGHAKRYEIFEEQSELFWSPFVAYALEDWRSSVNELKRSEIEEAYDKLGIDADIPTDQKARRHAISRFKTDKEKAMFWRIANKHFVYDEIIYIGALGWTVKEYAKEYGLRRVQFTILHIPIAEIHEKERTKAIATLFRKDKGDNSFLLRRLSVVSDQLEGSKQRVTDIMHANERLKAENAESQRKLAEAYEEIRQLRNMRPVEPVRSDSDRIKIKNQKQLITELVDEVKRLEGLLPIVEEPTKEELEVDVIEETPTEKYDPNQLEGKTVVIIGGNRKEQATEFSYPCEIIAVNAEDTDLELNNALKRADYIAVLTRHVSHAMMWEAKAYAVSENVPIIFCSEINVNRILYKIMSTHVE